MRAEVTIDGRRVDADTVAFDRFNFGRQGERPMVLHDFRLVAAQGAFLERFTPVFDRVMAELRDDDARHGFDPLGADAERRSTLDQMLALPHSARMQAVSPLSFEILGLYVGARDDRLRWVGMSIDDIRLEAGQLTVVGTVRRPVRRPSPVRRFLTRLKTWLESPSKA